jgi:dTDP-4-amino-4,6-dideoxygalactose transaminase
VALPAYTCFSVAASIVHAGLKLYPVDVDPTTLDFDFSKLEALPLDHVLCIITSNLFGLANDVERIQKVALAKGAFVVDDAAQGLGASRNGHFAGTVADVAMYSLGRGKATGIVQGGLIATNSEEISRSIQREVENLPAPSLPDMCWLLVQLLSGGILLHPCLYWIPNSLPFLKLGKTEFDPNFSITTMPELSKYLLLELLDELEQLNHVRRKNAAVLTEALVGNNNFSMPRPAPDSQPTYIRFPVLARTETIRSLTLAILHRAGIGASAFYPSAICDIPGIEQHMTPHDFHRPTAEDLSRRLLTLPTHSYVRPADLDLIATLLTNTLKI